MNNLTALTQDFTTDPQGRILSMTYDTTGEGYDGELYFHYDHFGNTTLLTDEEGDPVASFEYDLYKGKIMNEWNNQNLDFLIDISGIKGGLTIKLSNQIIISHNFCKTEISNNIYKTILKNEQTNIDNKNKINEKVISNCNNPCEGKSERTFVGNGDWDRIPTMFMLSCDQKAGHLTAIPENK